MVAEEQRSPTVSGSTEFREDETEEEGVEQQTQDTLDDDHDYRTPALVGDVLIPVPNGHLGLEGEEEG